MALPRRIRRPLRSHLLGEASLHGKFREPSCSADKGLLAMTNQPLQLELGYLVEPDDSRQGMFDRFARFAFGLPLRRKLLLNEAQMSAHTWCLGRSGSGKTLGGIVAPAYQMFRQGIPFALLDPLGPAA